MEPNKTKGTFGAFMSKVYGVMGISVLITAIVSLLITLSPDQFGLIEVTTTYGPNGEVMRDMSLSGFFWGIFIAELVLVFGLIFTVRRLPPVVGGLMLFVYAAMSGVTLTPIIFVSTGENVMLAFVMAVVVFSVAAAYGHFTKKDLTKLGGLLMIALISLVVAMIINIFIGSTLMMMAISGIAVILFTVLTAYDVQAFRAMHAETDTKGVGGLVILAALSMYLNMINLFIHILRLLNIFNGD